MVRFSKLLKSYLDTDHLTIEIVNGIDSNDKIIQEAKDIISLILQNLGDDATQPGGSMGSFDLAANHGFR